MGDAEIDWKKILQDLVVAVMPMIIKMILEWLGSITTQEAVATGTKAGKFLDAARKELA